MHTPVFAVYRVSFEDSPVFQLNDVTIKPEDAARYFNDSRKYDYDEDDNENGDWSLTHIKSLYTGAEYEDVPKPGDTLFFLVKIEWTEFVETKIIGPFLSKEEAKEFFRDEKEIARKTGDYPDTDEDDWNDDSAGYFHGFNEKGMDLYLEIHSAVLK